MEQRKLLKQSEIKSYAIAKQDPTSYQVIMGIILTCSCESKEILFPWREIAQGSPAHVTVIAAVMVVVHEIHDVVTAIKSNSDMQEGKVLPILEASEYDYLLVKQPNILRKVSFCQQELLHSITYGKI